MARSTPTAIVRPLLGALVLVLTAALGPSPAGAEPPARSAKPANSMIATITDVTPPDSHRLTYLSITGRVTAASGKYAPRKCRSGRVIDVTSPTVGGAIAEVGSSYPTTRKGRFRVGLTMDYAGYDADGMFLDGYVLESGGTATFTLRTSSSEDVKVPRAKGDPFRSYTCRPLLLTVQISVPPIFGA